MHHSRSGLALLSAAILASCAVSPDARDGDDDQGTAEVAQAVTSDPAPDADADLAVSAAAAPAVKLEAFFAVPRVDGTDDPTLENKVIQLIGQAPKGSHIRIALYHFTHTKPARALVAAAQRGVNVEIILDKQINQVPAGVAPAAVAATAEVLAAAEAVGADGDALVDAAADARADDDAVAEDAGDGAGDRAGDAVGDAAADDAVADVEPDADDDVGIEDAASTGEDVAAAGLVLDSAVDILTKGLPKGAVTFCTRGKGSCQGTGINHNKMYLFSSLSDGSKTVVVQSSANLTTFKLHNNLVISRNDKSLYDGYVATWNALKARKENLNFYRAVHGAHTVAYFYPRKSGDTVISVLNNVKCTAASKIRVAMAFFTDGRADVANKLVALKKAGCDVQIVMRKAGPNSSAKIIKTLKAGHIKVGLFPDAHANIHSKYLLIDSKYDTNGAFVRRQLVYTGSHNYTGGALRTNDETLLRIDNAAVFNQFLANWNTIRKQIP